MIEKPHVLINSQCNVDVLEEMLAISGGEASPVVFQENQGNLYGSICEITAKWASAEVKIRSISNTFLAGQTSLDEIKIAQAVHAIFDSTSTEWFKDKTLPSKLHNTIEGDLDQSVKKAANLLACVAFSEDKDGAIPMQVQLPSPINEGYIILRTPTAHRHGQYGNHLLEMIGRTQPHMVINKAYMAHTIPYVRILIDSARTTVNLDRPDPINLMSQIACNPTLKSIAR